MSTQLEIAAFEAVEQIKTSKDPLSVRDHLLKYVSNFGLDSFVITELPPVGLDFGAHIILSAWSQAWHHRYTSRKHYDNDPVAREAWNTTNPFIWSEALAEADLTASEQRVMDEATDFGLRDGFMVPLHTISGLSTCVSFAGPHVELPPRASDAIYFVAIHAYEAADRLRHTIETKKIEDKNENKNLTLREREILGWVARGRTDRDIGAICGISRKTVSAHVTSAAGKLDALNRTHAAVKALLAGELRASDLP